MDEEQSFWMSAAYTLAGVGALNWLTQQYLNLNMVSSALGLVGQSGLEPLTYLFVGVGGLTVLADRAGFL